MQMGNQESITTQLWVPCVPAPKGSSRAIPIKTGKACPVCRVSPVRIGFIAGSADSTKGKQDDMGKCVRAALLAYTRSHPRFGAYEGPVKLTLNFYMPRPGNRKKDIYHTTYPDFDKLTRMAVDLICPPRKGKTPDLDAPHLIRNDSQICRWGEGGKYYVTDEQPEPGVWYVIEPLA
jgi:Holliday junction resolvase RusA-like endonuclease